MRELGLENREPVETAQTPPNPQDQIDLSVQGGKFLGPRMGVVQPRDELVKSSRRDRQGNKTIISEKGQLLAAECAEKTAWETRL